MLYNSIGNVGRDGRHTLAKLEVVLACQRLRCEHANTTIAIARSVLLLFVVSDDTISVAVANDLGLETVPVEFLVERHLVLFHTIVFAPVITFLNVIAETRVGRRAHLGKEELGLVVRDLVGYTVRKLDERTNFRERRGVNNSDTVLGSTEDWDVSNVRVKVILEEDGVASLFRHVTGEEISSADIETVMFLVGVDNSVVRFGNTSLGGECDSVESGGKSAGGMCI